MARQERAIRTRRAVLEAAAEVFAEFGYEAATITMILDRAGVKKGALYFHFASKEELALGVLEHAVTEPPPEQLLKLQTAVDMGLVLAYRLPREPLLRASARLAADQNARHFFGEPWNEWVRVMTTQLTEAKERGEVLPYVDATATAEMLVGSFNGIQMLSQAVCQMADLETRISRMYDLTLPAIAAPAILGQIDTSPARGLALYEQQQKELAESPDSNDSEDGEDAQDRLSA
ncbi:ScbR family autoregulator-binding transcription factor [Streptomyces purpureus]|uniref:ScbR family autoregulator-binding transcription factor n=1 Tax=Streptomyces purpureus TaxID=1951 RepID=UPI0003756047|nr:ScbR family autoregulator-binding transcription factor [Streptomyces purpureus]